ncbi:MAG: LamG domain-containing protein, partial [Minisyncoccia bacterium]
SFYKNGVQLGTTQTLASNLNLTLSTLGSYDSGAFPTIMALDDVRVYSYARTQDEILADYNAGKAAHLGKDSQRDDGLVGYWNMEEGKGQTISDRSGNGNNGTLGANTSVGKDDPVFTSGYSSAGPGGTGLKFDGVDDAVNAGSASSLDDIEVQGGGGMTVSAWIYPKSGGENTTGIIVAKPNITDDSGRWGFYINSSQRIVFMKNYLTQNLQSYTSAVINFNTWQHVVLTWNGGPTASTDIVFFLNGNQLSHLSDSNGVGTKNSDASSSFYIGNDRYLGRTFDGLIDEVRVYNRALSEDEIRQLYNQKKPILEMKFDEGSGQIAYDGSFNNNDGTLGSTSGVDANDPTWTTGKFGSALQFDGANDYVSIPEIIPNGPSSFSAWFKTDSNANMAIIGEPSWWSNSYGYGIEINNKQVHGLAANNNIDWYNNLTSGILSTGWNNAVLTFNSWGANTTGILYINGQEVDSYTGTADRYGSYSSFIGGARVADNYGKMFNGIIDEPRIYNYARTPAEILVDYNNGLAAHLR